MHHVNVEPNYKPRHYSRRRYSRDANQGALEWGWAMISSPLMPLDTTTLQMALIGYEAERQKIQGKIAEIQRQLNGRGRRASAPVTATPAARTKPRMSASARRRIAAAQKKRWAEYRKKQKAA